MPRTAFETTLDTLPNATVGAEQPGAVVSVRAGKKKAPGPVPPKTEEINAAPCMIPGCTKGARYHSEECQQFIFCIENQRFPCFCDKHLAAVAMKRMNPPGLRHRVS